jgi:hypothetical protein
MLHVPAALCLSPFRFARIRHSGALRPHPAGAGPPPRLQPVATDAFRNGPPPVDSYREQVLHWLADLLPAPEDYGPAAPDFALPPLPAAGFRAAAAGRATEAPAASRYAGSQPALQAREGRHVGGTAATAMAADRAAAGRTPSFPHGPRPTALRALAKFAGGRCDCRSPRPGNSGGAGPDGAAATGAGGGSHRAGAPAQYLTCRLSASRCFTLPGPAGRRPG